MHTAILAMVGGTPVVPVEGSSFKITGLFQELGFEQPVIGPTAGDWPRQVVERALALRTQRDAAAKDVTHRVATVRDRITSLLLPRLQAAAERHS
jgi:polysaccharide pyruvyl transferase WcaK-like protein